MMHGGDTRYEQRVEFVHFAARGAASILIAFKYQT
ncbi:hypothetical protein SAMN05444165_0637 [Paraburkholderia phenazinium]|jgi:hypothetical protein|uniref:Uncharacterized protein n=1 Tax=Paraburkholderia phenazinium TaxID=60549 RepID=A0A1N6G9G9_9BURK|nr:hypothetical protein SAMN05444165_0637 [Paraburkholderia phenazinium]